MPRARRVCPTSGCPNLCDGGRCVDCRREAERKRGSAAARGYDRKHERTFREAVLLRDPVCVCVDPGHGHGPQCMAPSKHADHHPLSRRDLVARALNPNDPKHGRGLCHRCHSKVTAQHQPGGWAAVDG